MAEESQRDESGERLLSRPRTEEEEEEAEEEQEEEVEES